MVNIKFADTVNGDATVNGGMGDHDISHAEINGDIRDSKEGFSDKSRNYNKHVTIIDRTMQNCEVNNCARKLPVQSSSFYETWDKSLPNYYTAKTSMTSKSMTLDDYSTAKSSEKPSGSILKNRDEQTPLKQEEIVISEKQQQQQHDNPFLPNGELSKLADYILEHSLLTRNKVDITDPDDGQLPENIEEMMVTAEETPLQASCNMDNNTTPKKKSKKSVNNGSSPKQVSVELIDITKMDTRNDTLKAQKVPHKGKCCTIQ